jgi:Rps23 Pro-64 3,4-dihydroxylase Tpa1-like proline 4-hydroxylase
MLHLSNLDGYLAFDERECRSEGQRLASQYRLAEPFPHIVIDDFIDPDLLRKVHDGYPATEGKQFFDRDQERFKFQFQPQESSSGLVRNLFAELNGQAFLAFLKELTGINGLLSDPYFEGGGLHETKRGGHLGVHADFNLHGRMATERRLNLLVYLNQDWDPEYGGQLELWDRQMNECVVSVEPVLGRAVIFNTALDSYHGHPDPLNCPPSRTRRSMATYYYTAPEQTALLPKRTTNFQARPGSHDRVDWAIKRWHFVNDWVPPRLQKIAHRLIG